MGKRAKKPICGAVIAFTGLRVAPVKAKQGRDSSEVYLFTGINIVSKTRLHHIENGHKSTSALDFGWGLPFCAVLRSAKISVLRIFCVKLRKTLISALISAVLRKNRARSAPRSAYSRFCFSSNSFMILSRRFSMVQE